MAITADEFKAIANEVLRKNPNRTDKQQERTWDEYFGTSSVVAAELWNNIMNVETVSVSSDVEDLSDAFSTNLSLTGNGNGNGVVEYN